MNKLQQLDAVPLGLLFDPQSLSVQIEGLTLLVLVLSSTWYGVKASELERAASETRNTDLEDRFRDIILTTRNQSVAITERAEQAAVGLLRASLCGSEEQSVSGGLAAAAIAPTSIALLDVKRLTSLPVEAEDGGSDSCNRY